MFCVIQEVQLKRPNPHGAYKELTAYSWTMQGKPPIWAYRYSGGRFERPHREAYKISIHESYRENGRVKKRQHSITTISYYDMTEYSLYDCVTDGWMQDIADKLGVSMDTLYETIYAKLEPLQERITKEHHQSEEYRTYQKHRQILNKYQEEKAAFAEKYSVDRDEYDYCFNVFGEVVNQDYLNQVIQKAKTSRRYWSYGSGTHTSSSYSNPSEDYSRYFVSSGSTYTEEEKQYLKKFYKALSRQFHPDMNLETDTTKEMQLLNKLKETWGL